MYQGTVALCASNAYIKKYYFNQDFAGLPQQIQEELQIMCVLFTEDVGGILKLEFYEDGTMHFWLDHEEGDLLYDEIGSVLKIKQLRQDRAEFFESLELYYKVFFLNEEMDGQ